MTQDEARQKIAKLVKKYESLSEKEIKAYNEANTKQAFILPLFAALGWDVFDTHEVALEEAASNKRVDFAFKLNDVARFYLEAKPLKADLNNPDYVKQAITYAYNNGVTWAILTNFEELRLFNAQKSTPFIQLTYEDFLTSFDKLWLLSRISISAEALNKEATQYGALPPAIPIEERLFKQLRQWREELFNQLYHYDLEWLKENQIDEVIQKLFNRLIFIRTAEDRNLEEKQLLSAVHQCKNGQLSATLGQVFQYYQGYYDSDLFEKHLLDSDRLFIEEPSLAKILNGLYEIPGGMADYDFSIIDADVLGRVYEQYLGYVASAVKAKAKEIQAKLNLGIKADTEFEITAKKQHRKEQGIYYTPKFVTDYIAKETIGRFIKENEHDNYNKILNMKILDPACGSGSFLIRAYDELLNYHAKVCGKVAAELPQEDRMPILTGSIFGVDLDQQAVEIARLNLLLCGLAKRDHLPPLTDNIKQGNSLISGTDEELKGYFGDNWRDKKPFNWEQKFKDIMAHGGFDVVIGNPPYLNIKLMPDDEKDFYRAKYLSASSSFDIYLLFVEKGLQLLRQDGRLGFIIPNKFIQASYATQFRQLILKRATLEQIVDFGDLPVFQESTTYPCILIIRKREPHANDIKYVQVKRLPPNLTEALAEPLAKGEYSDDQFKVAIVGQEDLREGEWRFRPSVELDIITKMQNSGIPLNSLVNKVFVGLQITPVEIFAVRILSQAGNDPQTGAKLVKATSKQLESKAVLLEKELLRPLIKSSEIGRYQLSVSGIYIIFPYELSSSERGLKATLIDEQIMRTRYPSIFQYLEANRSKLEARDKGKWKDSDSWYGYSRKQNLECHGQCKIVTPNIATGSRFAWDEGYYYLDRGSFGILPESADTKYQYLLGILNSSLGEYYIKQTSPYVSGGYYSFTTSYLSPFPIRRIDFDNPTDKKLHDALVALVDRMLELNKRLAPIRDVYSHERDELVKEIEKTDKEIDNLVYQLYDLTEEERKIVEGDSK